MDLVDSKGFWLCLCGIVDFAVVVCCYGPYIWVIDQTAAESPVAALKSQIGPLT